MVNEEVQFIKTHKKTYIEKSTHSTYGVLFGYKGKLIGDACFARLHKRIAEQEKGGAVKSSLQYILRYEENSKLFAYRTLIKELNKIFGKYYKITMHPSGRKSAKIINIKEIKKLPSKSIKYVGYYMILVLLRAIDGEYLAKWQGAYKGKKINNWFDIIYHHYKTMSIWGHGINDSVGELGQNARNKRTKGNEKLFRDSIEHYLDTLTIAFNSNMDYKTIKNKNEMSFDSYRTKGQTPSFKYIEKLVQQGGRK